MEKSDRADEEPERWDEERESEEEKEEFVRARRARAFVLRTPLDSWAGGFLHRWGVHHYQVCLGSGLNRECWAWGPDRDPHEEAPREGLETEIEIESEEKLRKALVRFMKRYVAGKRDCQTYVAEVLTEAGARREDVQEVLRSGNLGLQSDELPEKVDNYIRHGRPDPGGSGCVVS